MMRVGLRRVFVVVCSVLVLCSVSACSRPMNSSLGSTQTSGQKASRLATQTLVGEWRPQSHVGIEAKPDAVLTIDANGGWKEFGIKLSYATRSDGRVDVWYNGAHTIHAVEVDGTTLTDHTPSGTVRRFTRKK